MEENSKLKKISKEIIQNYTYEMETQCLDTEQFTMLSSKRYFVKIKKKLENIQTSLDTITSSENPHSILHICEEELILAIQRGFRVRIMTNKLQEGKPMDDLEKNIEKHPNFEIRYIKKSPSVLINIYDKHEASLFTGNPSTTKKPTLWVSNPGMLSIFQKYYDTLWSDAIKN